MIDALHKNLADMDEAVLFAKEVHEGPEIDDFDDLTFIDNANFRLSSKAVDPFLGRFDRFFIG